MSKVVENPEDVSEEEATRLTNWEKEPTFEDLYRDYQSASKDVSQLSEDVIRWRKLLNGGNNIVAPENRSTLKSRLIRKQAEWKYPSLEDPFLSTQDLFNINPRTADDITSAEVNQTVLNYQWSVQVDRNKFVTKLVRQIYNDGTVIVKTGWDYRIRKKKVKENVPVYANGKQSAKLLKGLVSAGKMSKEQALQIAAEGKPIQVGSRIVLRDKYTTYKNEPKYEVCDMLDIIIDPTAEGDIGKAKFVIHEYETDYSELKEHEKRTIVKKDQETGEVSEYTVGYYVDLKKAIQQDIADQTDTTESKKHKNNNISFRFKDIARKKIKAVDYWGYWDIEGNGETTLIVATWIGKTLIRLEKNPFPFDELPFSVAKYMPVTDKSYGEPDAELLSENQETIGKMTRAVMDIVGQQAVGQEFIDENLFSSPLQKDNYKKGKTVFFRSNMDPKRGIYRRTVDQVPNSVFNIIDMSKTEADSMSGIKSFSKGIGSQSLGNVAAGIRSSLDAESKRELSILRRIAEDIFKDIARKTIAMNQVFLDDKTVVRISNKKFVTINREDLYGEFDLIVAVSTPEVDNSKAEKLNMLMQTNAASMDPELQKVIYAKLARLWKFPDLEKEILDFKPQPNPIAEKTAQLQLENAALENQRLKMEIAKSAKLIESEDSKIEERISRTAQNLNSETAENNSTARLKNAQAGLIEAQTKQVAVDIKKETSGQKRKEYEEDVDAKFLSDKKLLAMKKMHDLELEELKHQLKERERMIDEFSKLVNIKLAHDKNQNDHLHKQTIAQAKMAELTQRTLEKQKNDKGAL